MVALIVEGHSDAVVITQLIDRRKVEIFETKGTRLSCINCEDTFKQIESHLPYVFILTDPDSIGYSIAEKILLRLPTAQNVRARKYKCQALSPNPNKERVFGIENINMPHLYQILRRAFKATGLKISEYLTPKYCTQKHELRTNQFIPEEIRQKKYKRNIDKPTALIVEGCKTSKYIKSLGTLEGLSIYITHGGRADLDFREIESRHSLVLILTDYDETGRYLSHLLNVNIANSVILEPKGLLRYGEKVRDIGRQTLNNFLHKTINDYGLTFSNLNRI